MEIRKAEFADYEEYCRLVTEVDELHARNAPRYFRMPIPEGRSLEYFQSVISSPHQVVFLSLDGKTAAGFIQMRLEKVPEIPILVPRSIGYIGDLVVDARYQRRGIGRSLLERAKTWAKELGACELSLSVVAFNSGARMMYEREGFQLMRSVMALPLDKD